MIMNDHIRRFPSNLPFPLSQAVEAGGFLFLSGQVSMSEAGVPLRVDVKTQTRNALAGIQRTLSACGADMGDIVKVTVWLSDMKHYADFNEAYASHFPEGFPARSVVASKVALDLDVEIEVQALAPAKLN
jgi:reactive intermediate/imine deaminase